MRIEGRCYRPVSTSGFMNFRQLLWNTSPAPMTFDLHSGLDSTIGAWNGSENWQAIYELGLVCMNYHELGTTIGLILSLLHYKGPWRPCR